jgi:hypothetical protein
VNGCTVIFNVSNQIKRAFLCAQLDNKEKVVFERLVSSSELNSEQFLILHILQRILGKERENIVFIEVYTQKAITRSVCNQ